jgi:RND family efflux transporter MFP subunit
VNPESADDPGDPARAGHGAEATSAPARRSKPRRVRVWLSLVAACFVAVAVIGLISRQLQFKKLQETTGVLDEQFVETVQPEKVPATVTLNLPGQTEAYTQAPIYAQVNGYLRSWYSDIGAKVKMGDVLAEIDTPALDQQLAQARANLKQSQATLWVSQANYNRQIDLLNKKVISQEDFDNQSGDLQAKQATVNAQEANVRQLEAMEAFKVLRAPFDGTVTVRDTDIGALINAGSGNPLFIVSQVSPLRAYVNVPESLAASVKAGTKANLTFDTFPGVEFPAPSRCHLRRHRSHHADATDAIDCPQCGREAFPRFLHDGSFRTGERFAIPARPRECAAFQRGGPGSWYCGIGWQGFHPENQDRS